MNRTGAYILLPLLLAGSISAQTDDRSILVTGDKGIGKTVNGEALREVIGHVVVTQGSVKITCDDAIHYIARNDAELMGNVIVTQDSVIIKTSHGFYYGNSRDAYSTSGVWLTDGHMVLTSKNGHYYFDEKRSHFYENVEMKDSASDLHSDRLDYWDDEDKAVAAGHVCISDTSSTVFADSLIHFRNSGASYAFNNVRIYDPENRLAIYGSKLENTGKKKYSRITGEPFLVKIDSSANGKFDTLFIASNVMEAYSDSVRKLVATDSVRILRGGFSSINQQAFYFEKGDKIQVFRRDPEEQAPVLWSDTTQLVGDSITVFLKENRPDIIKARSHASIISIDRDSLFRYNQISGKLITLFFGKEGLERTEVEGSALSIYYVYDEGKPNGMLKSSSDRAKMFFGKKEVSDVHLYGKPVTEYHPENLLKGKERDFTIPTFKLYKRKPTRKDLLKTRKEILSYLKKEEKYYAGKPNSPKRKP
jgi:lipopolysaccharide export system protein LptA